MAQTIKSPQEILEVIQSKIGVATNKTLLYVEATQDENKKILTLLNGEWGVQPWIGVDGEQNIFTMISLDALQKVASNINEVQKENFKLKLEKAIWKHIPVDFQDVWSVAMSEVDLNGTRFSEADLDVLISKIKKNHPNLFVDVKRFLKVEND